jgi:hypothetical protein
VRDNVDVATFRYPTATELRVYVIQSTRGLDDRRFLIDVPGLTVRLSRRRTVTMQVADDDASVAWELLRVVSGLRCELVERDVCREQLMDGVGHIVGLPERGDREPRTTNVVDRGHDLDRLAIGALLVPFAEEQAAARGSRQVAQ